MHLLQLIHFVVVKRLQLTSQHVAAWISGDVNWHSLRQKGIPAPEFGIIFTPGKQVRHVTEWSRGPADANNMFPAEDEPAPPHPRLQFDGRHYA